MSQVSVKKKQAKGTRIRAKQRKEFWPEVSDSELWNRKIAVGFTTIPRTLTLISRIMDAKSSGQPLSDTYLTLWCWVFDENFLEIKNAREMAFESGFSGQRAETTWNSRMKKLKDLGFIDAREGPYGPFQYVLMFNPIKVIKRLYEGEPQDSRYRALVTRLAEIGAGDLDE